MKVFLIVPSYSSLGPDVSITDAQQWQKELLSDPKVSCFRQVIEE